MSILTTRSFIDSRLADLYDIFEDFTKEMLEAQLKDLNNRPYQHVMEVITGDFDMREDVFDELEPYDVLLVKKFYKKQLKDLNNRPYQHMMKVITGDFDMRENVFDELEPYDILLVEEFYKERINQI